MSTPNEKDLERAVEILDQWTYPPNVRDAIAQALAEERERAAKKAEAQSGKRNAGVFYKVACDDIAVAIRAGDAS